MRDCCYFALLALWFQLFVYKQYVFDVPEIVFGGLISIPLLYFIVYSAYRLILCTGVFQRCRCYQRLRCLKDDAENNDYVLPHRLDDPGDYTDVPSTTMPKKKPVELNVSDVDEEYDSATVHGVTAKVSLVKSSSNNPKIKYFTWKMSDCTKTVRVISFDPGLRPRFAESFEKNGPIALVNCKVQETQSKATNCQSELVASTKCCSVVKSEKEFEVLQDRHTIDPDVSKEIMLSAIPSCTVNQYVTVEIKVLDVSAPVTVESKKSVVGDS